MNLRQLFTEIASGWEQAKNEQFTGHPIATLLRQDLIKAIEKKLQSPTKFLIKASAGAGNWADVPWLSILNPAITESTQSGIYPVYLFRSDGSGIYLSLGFGTTELKKQYGTAQAKQKAEELRNSIRGSDNRTWLANHRPDIVLRVTLENGEAFFILFDAKYRIDTTQFGGKDAVPEDAINQMHRYRDA